MRATQVTTWRRYTAAEKKAYRARVARRRVSRFIVGGQWDYAALVKAAQDTAKAMHHFADNFGSGVPTARVNGEVL